MHIPVPHKDETAGQYARRLTGADPVRVSLNIHNLSRDQAVFAAFAIAFAVDHPDFVAKVGTYGNDVLKRMSHAD